MVLTVNSSKKTLIEYVCELTNSLVTYSTLVSCSILRETKYGLGSVNAHCPLFILITFHRHTLKQKLHGGKLDRALHGEYVHATLLLYVYIPVYQAKGGPWGDTQIPIPYSLPIPF